MGVRRRGVVRTALAAVVVVAAVLAASVAGAEPEGAGGQAEHGADATGGGPAQTEAPGAFGIDPGSRESVRTSYLQDLVPTFDFSVGWTGSVDSCNAGTISADARQKALDHINWVRELAGLSPVTDVAGLADLAQEAVLVQEALVGQPPAPNPPPQAPCYTAGAAAGSAASNLGKEGAGPDAVYRQMREDGDITPPGIFHWGSDFVSRRRAFLYPPVTQVGIGATDAASAIYVRDVDSYGPSTDDWVAWPSQGWFPEGLRTQRWSLSREGADMTEAQVQISIDGGAPSSPTVLHRSPTSDTFDTIVFQQFLTAGDGPDRTYHVEVTGIGGDGVPDTYEYDVHAFDPAVDGQDDPCLPPAFSDVPQHHPFFTDVCWMDTEAISTGYPDGTYKPAAAVSRGAMSAFMYRLAGEPPFTAPGTPSFSDVPTDYAFYDEVEWMAETGITTGYGDGTYRAGDPVSRGAMSAFMYRLAGEPATVLPVAPTFSDVPEAFAFYEEIEWMADTGISTGYGDGTYKPGAAVSRQAMSAFMHRLADGPGVDV